MKRLCFALLIAVAVIACGDKKGGTIDGGDPTGDGNGGDGGPTADARVPTGCTEPIVGAPQCSDCVDNDNDGAIDGFDIECTGPQDNDEGSFATGIPGDNIDAVKQDCFFDGNSGAGDDGCNIHVCCILGAQTVAECPIGANQYKPNECPPPIGTAQLPQMCFDVCAPLTPPGCDCFGCCTVCDPDTNVCVDIATNPATSPGCNQDTLDDPTVCKRCTKSTVCGDGTCGGGTCILCPGQTEEDLPAECMGMNSCPDNAPTCEGTPDCSEGAYCSNGCCIGIIL